MTFSQRGSASFPKSLARRQRRMGGHVADARPSPLIRTPIITFVPYPSRYPSFVLFLSSWLENFCHESQVSNWTVTPFLGLLFLSNRNNTITNNKKKNNKKSSCDCSFRPLFQPCSSQISCYSSCFNPFNYSLRIYPLLIFALFFFFVRLIAFPQII